MSLSMAAHHLLSPRRPNNFADAQTAFEAFSEEIKCYNLPYGILGFVSHVLTYYTILCLWLGRKPLWPFSRVKFSGFDLALGGVGLLISTLLSIVTIIRCKDNWELTVIAVWKLGMSLLNGVTAVHISVVYIFKKMKLKKELKKAQRREASEESGSTVVEKEGRPEEFVDEELKVTPEELAGQNPFLGVKAKKNEQDKETKEKKQKEKVHVAIDPLRSTWVAWWILLYIPSMIAGIAGLMALVVRLKAASHSGVRGLTAGFYTIVGVGILSVVAGIIFLLRAPHSDEEPAKAKKLVIGGLAWVVGSFSILAVFYSDWVLGVMTRNLTGLPSGDNSALFWTYWVAKRLPMFSL